MLREGLQGTSKPVVHECHVHMVLVHGLTLMCQVTGLLCALGHG